MGCRLTAAAGLFTVRELPRDLSSFNGCGKNFAYRVIDNKVCVVIIRSDGFVNQNEFIAGVIINKSGGGVDLERCAADNKHIGAGYMRDCARKNIGIERFFIKHNIGFYHAAAGTVRNAAVVFYIFGIKKSVAAHTVIAMN